MTIGISSIVSEYTHANTKWKQHRFNPKSNSLDSPVPLPKNKKKRSTTRFPSILCKREIRVEPGWLSPCTSSRRQSQWPYIHFGHFRRVVKWVEGGRRAIERASCARSSLDIVYGRERARVCVGAHVSMQGDSNRGPARKMLHSRNGCACRGLAACDSLSLSRRESASARYRRYSSTSSQKRPGESVTRWKTLFRG